ncbi:MAG: hypothetical protein Q7K21_01270 [Elusimicrobiota bacterium]|nr:hypothetical protein [Elusimicrobiota bacterium]
MNNIMDLGYLITSENETKLITEKTIVKVPKHIPNIINTLFAINYCHGNLDDVETQSGVYQSFCCNRYITLPYTTWSIYSLWIRGNYLESVILFRHILEMFIQFKYFGIYPEKLGPHIAAKTSKDRVSFKNIFDEFSEGYYTKYYGRLLSSCAHGGIMSTYFRVDHHPRSGGKVYTQNEYVQEKAGYIMNQLFIILLGYLYLFPIIFPTNTLSDNSDISNLYDTTIKWFEHWWSDYKKQFPEANGWCQHMDKFVLLKNGV